jgi:hypothetical protein
MAASRFNFHASDGNTNDSVTHIATWNTLRTVTGRMDFLYVADSKLCSHDNTDHIHRPGGHFVTLMPRSRREDARFRKWIQTSVPAWQIVRDCPHPRYRNGPRDCWFVYRAPLGSIKGWPSILVWSTLLTLRLACMDCCICRSALSLKSPTVGTGDGIHDARGFIGRAKCAEANGQATRLAWIRFEKLYPLLLSILLQIVPGPSRQ